MATSCWLSLASQVRGFLSESSEQSEVEATPSMTDQESFEFLGSFLEDSKRSLSIRGSEHALLATPVSLGHGIDNFVVCISWVAKQGMSFRLLGSKCNGRNTQGLSV